MRIRPDHDHPLRRFVDDIDVRTPVDKAQSGRCHALIKSRRRSSGGDGRHNGRQVRPTGRHGIAKSARHQPEDLQAGSDVTAQHTQPDTERNRISPFRDSRSDQIEVSPLDARRARFGRLHRWWLAIAAQQLRCGIEPNRPDHGPTFVIDTDLLEVLRVAQGLTERAAEQERAVDVTHHAVVNATRDR